MARQISSITYHTGRISLWYTGADPQSDYYPAAHGLTQAMALRMLAEDGHTEGCMVEASGYTTPDVPEDERTRRARRFAVRAGLQLRLQISWPYRRTYEEAAADLEIYASVVAELAAQGQRCEVRAYGDSEYRVVTRRW